MAQQSHKGFSAEDMRQLVKRKNENPTISQGWDGPVPRFLQFPDQTTTMVLTCMDPRCNPHVFLDTDKYHFAIVRNAGGRAKEFLKSAQVLTVIAKQRVGTVAVVHHTDCGLLNYDNEYVREKLKSANPHLTEEQLAELKEKDFGGMSDAEGSVREDMEIIKADAFLPKDLEVVGLVYDSFTGKLTEVV